MNEPRLSEGLVAAAAALIAWFEVWDRLVARRGPGVHDDAGTPAQI